MSDPTAKPIPERKPTGISEDRVALMIDNALSEHADRMVKLIKEEFTKLSTEFKGAFPNGDPHGHKAAHEAQIENANNWKKIKADFISKAFTSGILAAIAFLFYAGIEAIKAEVRK